jgi:hypothetical protein
MPTTILIVICVAWSGASLLMAVLLIRSFVDGLWNTLARAHPAVEPSADAVRREFQSFKMGMFNLGLSVHVEADDEHLHLSPAAFIRWMGATPMSIPWEAIEVMGQGLIKSSTKARIGSVTIYGPTWCLSLASQKV